MNTAISTDTPFASLTPDLVLQAVENLGLQADGRLLALNSYENRVYRVGIDADSHPVRGTAALRHAVVAKFYRPNRWSAAQIREEHAFALELVAAELAVAAPLVINGETLHDLQGQWYTLFECWPGATPEFDAPGNRQMLGRTLGRMHAVGARRRFEHRQGVRDWHAGARARHDILARGTVPAALEARYAEVSAQLIEAVEQRADHFAAARNLRIHGDCHVGNILWNAQGPVFVDFDDCLTGPAVQDLWMFCAGTPAQQQREWSEVLEGYEQFAHLDYAEVALIEPLRAMRMLNHAAWIAARWADPAFPLAFPWFAEPRFWERHISDLIEQIEAVEDPPLLRGG
jgi:Ser/Thr protein kinase RdoA (MazF antagonist)